MAAGAVPQLRVLRLVRDRDRLARGFGERGDAQVLARLCREPGRLHGRRPADAGDSRLLHGRGPAAPGADRDPRLRPSVGRRRSAALGRSPRGDAARRRRDPRADPGAVAARGQAPAGRARDHRSGARSYDPGPPRTGDRGLRPLARHLPLLHAPPGLVGHLSRGGGGVRGHGGAGGPLSDLELARPRNAPRDRAPPPADREPRAVQRVPHRAVREARSRQASRVAIAAGPDQAIWTSPASGRAAPTGSAIRVWGVAPTTRTLRSAPGGVPSPANTTLLNWRLLPKSCPGSRRAGPSTRTSATRPIQASLSCPEMACWSAIRCSSRRPFSSSVAVSPHR